MLSTPYVMYSVSRQLRHDLLLKRCLAHTFAGVFPQSFDIAHGWLAKELFVLAVEVRGIIIAHAVARACRIQALTEHEAAGLLQPQLLLELQRAHCGQRP